MKTAIFNATRFGLLFSICCASALFWAGCASQQQQQQQPRSSRAPAPEPAPAPAPGVLCSDATSGLIRMTKTMPPSVTTGGTFASELNLTAQGCAANVVVQDMVPANASYVRSEPAATVDGDQLTWTIGKLDAGEARNIKLWLKAEKEGMIVNCASVSADPR